MADLEDRVAAEAGDVQRVVRLVPRQRARLVLADRRGRLLGGVAAEPEERELVDERRLAAAAVAPRALGTVVVLHRRLALERHDRLLGAEEGHRERGARKAIAVVAATATALHRAGVGERERLAAVAAQVDL